jgi:DNA-binding transcriptional LysR family regulator
MTFEQVLVFHKIVHGGSFRAAAVELRKTQPAISFAIKKLEAELEVKLFDRDHYRPQLSSSGKAFYEKSLKVIQGMEELESLSASFKHHEEPQLFISLDGIFLGPEVLSLFKSFTENYPNTKVNLSLDILSETCQKVLSGEAHLGMTHFISEKAALDAIPMTSIRMLPVMSKELYQERKVSQEEDLLGIDQVVVTDKSGPRGTKFGLLENGKKWYLQDANFKRDIILAGLGWGHLPEHTIERELREKKLIVLKFKHIAPRELDIQLIRLKKNPLGPVGKKLWDELTRFYEKKSRKNG